MNIESILESIPSYGVDIKLNIKNLLNTTVLSKMQVAVTFISCAVVTKNKALIDALINHFSQDITEVEVNAAKTAGTIMAMTNVYYRFTHLASNKAYSTMPVGLRMNGLAPSKHGIASVDFELASLACSAINGCGMCIDSHEKVLQKHEVEATKIQEAIKIAASVNALATML